MAKLRLLFLTVFFLRAARACNDDNETEEQLNNARQNSLASAYLFAKNPWFLPYYSSYYQPSNNQEYDNPYEGRTPLNRQPSSNSLTNYFRKYNNDVDKNEAEGRFGLGQLGASILNAGIFNNRFTSSGTTFRPFASLSNQLPISLNPNYVNPISTFETCTSPSGESGICSPGSVCSLFGGRPSGSCLFGGVCCINAITTCGASVTLNNTYWQSPTTAVSAPSTCALTVKLDTKFVEQKKKPVCQVRLDFISFSIAQPTAGTCSDTFQVGGAINKVPTICGDNNGQHMYLEVPSSALKSTDLQLMLNFASGTATRSWNIKISMLPCGASYLAPTDCLQYFTASTGKVSSFNWKDTTGQRQLNNQDYNICFRTELIESQKANQICLTVCTPTNGGDGFSLTTVAAPAPADPAKPTAAETAAIAAAPFLSAAGTATCQYDFLLVAGASTTANVAADRFCGNELNPAVPGVAASVQICTRIKPFRLVYQTDSTEAAVVGPPAAPADANNNVGFCLDFQERST